MKIKNLIIGFVLIISIIQLVSAEDYIHVNAGDGLFLPGEKISLDVCGTVPEVEIFVDEMPSTYVTDGLFGKVNPKGYKPTANVEKFKVNLEEPEKNCYNRSNGEVYCNLNCKPLYVNISATGPGIYRIYARSGDLQGNNDFTVSRLGLITKRSNDKLLVYAVDLADGNPIKNLSVFFYNDSCSSNEKTTFLYSKKTDERGLIITDINETINSDSDLKKLCTKI